MVFASAAAAPARPALASFMVLRFDGMTQSELLRRITIDPAVCFGRPCIVGRRIWVSLVLDLLASGASMEEIAREYDLEHDDIRACIAYGAEMARYTDLPLDVPR